MCYIWYSSLYRFYLVYSLKQRLRNVIFHNSQMRTLKFRDTSNWTLLCLTLKPLLFNQLPQLSRYINWKLSINSFHIFISVFGSVMLIGNNNYKKKYFTAEFELVAPWHSIRANLTTRSVFTKCTNSSVLATDFSSYKSGRLNQREVSWSNLI